MHTEQNLHLAAVSSSISDSVLSIPGMRLYSLDASGVRLGLKKPSLYASKKHSEWIKITFYGITFCDNGSSDSSTYSQTQIQPPIDLYGWALWIRTCEDDKIFVLVKELKRWTCTWIDECNWVRLTD